MPGRNAFTLVELLVVIVVISLLASIVTPYVQVAVEQARQSDCRKRLQNLHGAAALYGSENRNLVPIVHDGSGKGNTGRMTSVNIRIPEISSFWVFRKR